MFINKYSTMLLLLGSSLNLFGMGYVKSFFGTSECLKDVYRGAERTKSYEDLKASIQKHELSWGKVTALQHKSDGKDTCVLEKLGQEEKANLYAQITNLVTQSKNKDFFDPKNRTASNQALHDAQNALAIIRLGSYEETKSPEFKLSETSLKDIESKLEQVPQEKISAAGKPAQKGPTS